MNETNVETKNIEVRAELAQWRTGLTAALALAGFRVVYHPLTTSGCRLGECRVYRLGASADSDTDICYKIEFQNHIKVTGSQFKGNLKRTAICMVNVYNPNGGGLHVNLKGYSPAKVEKIVAYATAYINRQLARESAVEAKRKRATINRAIWSDSKVEVPDWITASANNDKDEDVGTFHLIFHEHRNNYGLNRLTPGQIARIVGYMQTVIAEPPVAVAEKELVDKLLQHEGKLPKYDRKADDKQWMHDTLNP